MPPRLKCQHVWPVPSTSPPLARDGSLSTSSILRCTASQHGTQPLFDRQFSTSPAHHARVRFQRQSKMRREFWRWLNGPGSGLKYPRKDSTNYLGAYDAEGNLIRMRGRRNDDEEEAQKTAGEDGTKTDVNGENNSNGGDSALDGQKRGGMPAETIEDLRPFPQNPYFRSEAVLSEELRTEIYRLHLQEEKTVREISIRHGVEMSRVAAVIRLKTIEQDWIRQEKPLARVYHNAVMKMLPKTPFNPSSARNPRHESINDLPVHPATKYQIFYPTSESKHFTRVDAGRVFHPTLLPADARIPHPEMIETMRDRLVGLRPDEQRRRQDERIRAMEEKRQDEVRAREEALLARTKNVKGVRWDFKFEDIRAESVGSNGRGPAGVGWRYGFPHEDRKRAHVKLPTSVD